MNFVIGLRHERLEYVRAISEFLKLIIEYNDTQQIVSGSLR